MLENLSRLIGARLTFPRRISNHQCEPNPWMQNWTILLSAKVSRKLCPPTQRRNEQACMVRANLSYSVNLIQCDSLVGIFCSPEIDSQTLSSSGSADKYLQKIRASTSIV